jgi:deoxycytidine triphosphate deaminase
MTDRQLRARLDELRFEAEDQASPFDADRQIGPCSVDLRVSRIYWVPRSSRVPPFRQRRVVDLERTRVMELSSRRGWRRLEIRPNDKITLKPGQMVLARTAERFVMPSDCAGRLEGRSSYARLGLSIHSTGSFINPGWRGHMPLT